MKTLVLLLTLSACAAPRPADRHAEALSQALSGRLLRFEGAEPQWAKSSGPFVVDGALYAVGRSAKIKNAVLALSTARMHATSALLKWSESYVSERSLTLDTEDASLRYARRLGISIGTIYGLEEIATWRHPGSREVAVLVRVNQPVIGWFRGRPSLISGVFKNESEIVEVVRHSARRAVGCAQWDPGPMARR